MLSNLPFSPGELAIFWLIVAIAGIVYANKRGWLGKFGTTVTKIEGEATAEFAKLKGDLTALLHKHADATVAASTAAATSATAAASLAPAIATLTTTNAQLSAIVVAPDVQNVINSGVLKAKTASQPQPGEQLNTSDLHFLAQIVAGTTGPANTKANVLLETAAAAAGQNAASLINAAGPAGVAAANGGFYDAQQLRVVDLMVDSAYTVDQANKIVAKWNKQNPREGITATPDWVAAFAAYLVKFNAS